MSSYKLTYFDFDGGRGEPIRVVLHAAGIEFEDHRVSFAEFGEMRQKLRFNALPVFAIDGETVTQSNGILRYVGKLAGLYPGDDLQALYCDEALGAIEDISHHLGATFRLQGDELRLAREKLVDGWLPVFLRGLDALLTRGGGQFFADQQFTVADLKVSYLVRWLCSGSLDHIPTDLVQQVAPNLVEHQQRTASDPRVLAYYAPRS